MQHSIQLSREWTSPVFPVLMCAVLSALLIVSSAYAQTPTPPTSTPAQQTPSEPTQVQAPTTQTPVVENTKQEKVGSAIPDMSQLMEKSVKGLIYSVVILLIFLGLLKRGNFLPKSPNSRLISIIERKQLGPKTALVIAEVEGTRLLLSDTGISLTLLCVLEKQKTDTAPKEEEEKA